jgi:hypothetical protein
MCRWGHEHLRRDAYITAGMHTSVNLQLTFLSLLRLVQACTSLSKDEKFISLKSHKLCINSIKVLPKLSTKRTKRTKSRKVSEKRGKAKKRCNKGIFNICKLEAAHASSRMDRAATHFQLSAFRIKNRHLRDRIFSWLSWCFNFDNFHDPLPAPFLQFIEVLAPLLDPLATRLRIKATVCDILPSRICTNVFLILKMIR